MRANSWYANRFVNLFNQAERLKEWKNDPEISQQYLDAQANCRAAFVDLLEREQVIRTRRID